MYDTVCLRGDEAVTRTFLFVRRQSTIESAQEVDARNGAYRRVLEKALKFIVGCIEHRAAESRRTGTLNSRARAPGRDNKTITYCYRITPIVKTML